MVGLPPTENDFIDGEACIKAIFRHIDWIAQSLRPTASAIARRFCVFIPSTVDWRIFSKLTDLAELCFARLPEESVVG